MLQRLIQVSWRNDLGSPEEPGTVIFGDGLELRIRQDKFNAAQSRLAEGKADVLFAAILVEALDHDPYYVLGAVIN
jgi:hypothetical protein